MAVPVRSELLMQVDSCARRALACWQRSLEGRRIELRAATRALPSAEELLALPRQRLDHAGARLPRALTANAQIHHTVFSRVASRLRPQLLQSRAAGCRDRMATLAERIRRAEAVAGQRRQERLAAVTLRLQAGLRANAEAHRGRIMRERDRTLALFERARRAMTTSVRQHRVAVARCGGLLAALSHRGVLARGFALVRDPAGRPVHAAAAVSPGLRLDIEFADGHVGARAEGGAAAEKPVRQLANAKPRRSAGTPGQGSLFED
jgi:exodeoxyribonuclease VII large subunit